jgi:hypothetical protein
LVAVAEKRLSMPFEGVWTALQLVNRAGFRLWSREARALGSLMLSTARKDRKVPWRKLSKQHVAEAALRLGQSKKARERIAQALGISSLDAWMVQENLKRAAEKQLAGRE